GADYIYTYMRSVYRDNSKLTGWDNLVFPSVAMPHVMWEEQGPRALTKTEVHHTEDGTWERVITHFDEHGNRTVTTEPVAHHVGHASMQVKFEAKDPARAQEFDRQMADLTAFMAWMAEPVQSQRKRIGLWVLLYLGLFLVIAWRLNAVYWKDVK